MPRFSIDDDLHSHPKAVMAGDAAIGMWSRAGTFCTAYGTDGFVPDWWVRQQPQGAAKAKRLVAAKMWHPGEYQGTRPEYVGQKGFNFHQWRQDSHEKVEADREKWRRKKEAQRAAQESKSPSMSPGDKPGDSPRDSRESPPEGAARAENADFDSKRGGYKGSYKGVSEGQNRNENNPPQNFPTSTDMQMSPGDSRGSPGYIPNTQYPKDSGYLGSASPDSTEREPRSAPVRSAAWKLVRQIVADEHPQAVRAELAMQASTLLNQGQPEELVADTLHFWTTKSVHPKALPSLLSELINTRNRSAEGSKSGPKIAASDAAFAAAQALKSTSRNGRLEIES